MQDLHFLQQDASQAIDKASDLHTVDQIRIEYLGKKGKLTELLKNLAHLDANERPKVGQLINQAKQAIITQIENKISELKGRELQKKIEDEWIDVTLPGRHSACGAEHPVSQMKQQINAYFLQLGFDILEGPEIETEFYNFEALNIPPHHPARAMHDTFYFADGQLLRTHTSPVQIRAMENKKPPLRLIAPGRVYRCDSDLTHTPMFHQVEGLLIDTNINLGHLKALLEDFFSYLFAKPLKVRFRPSYFPFTEPSAEVDLECTQCLGKGCRSCKFSGWLEVLGCGMVHPHVLTAVNISPDEYRGWAFGLGIDRLAMLYFGVDDLRTMFENDINFLKQF